MAKKKQKNKDLPEKIILVKGMVAIICPVCLNNIKKCYRCINGFVYQELYQGDFDLTKFEHTVYEKQKQK